MTPSAPVPWAFKRKPDGYGRPLRDIYHQVSVQLLRQGAHELHAKGIVCAFIRTFMDAHPVVLHGEEAFILPFNFQFHGYHTTAAPPGMHA